MNHFDQRNNAWAAGDTLAKLLDEIVSTGKLYPDKAKEALENYCKVTGWNGPAGQWAVKRKYQ